MSNLIRVELSDFCDPGEFSFDPELNQQMTQTAAPSGKVTPNNLSGKGKLKHPTTTQINVFSKELAFENKSLPSGI